MEDKNTKHTLSPKMDELVLIAPLITENFHLSSFLNFHLLASDFTLRLTSQTPVTFISRQIRGVVIFPHLSFIPSAVTRLGSLQPAKLARLVFSGGHGLSVDRSRVGCGTGAPRPACRLTNSKSKMLSFGLDFFQGFGLCRLLE